MNLKELRKALAEKQKARKEARTKMDELLKELRSGTSERSVDDIQADVDAVCERAETLDAEIEDLNDQIERELRIANVRSGRVDLTTIDHRALDTEDMSVEEARASEEYRRAWLRNIAVDREGRHMFGEMTDAEQRAFTFTTANTGAVVPTITQNRIVDRLRHEAPMLEDATVTSIVNGFAIPVRTAIAGGDAAVVAQDAANSDEEDTFDLITMTGVDIKKHATMTRRMEFQSIDAFEDWLVEDISKRIMVAKEAVIRARLDGSAPSAAESANNKVKIDAGNVLTGDDVVYSDAVIRQIMAKIDEPGQVVVYANRYTIFNGLAGINDGAGHKAFINTPQDDPTIKGVIYGAVVKEDCNLANNVAYFGVRGALKANNFAPLEITPAIEPKTANRIFTGSEIFDAGLENPKAFVKATFVDELESE